MKRSSLRFKARAVALGLFMSAAALGVAACGAGSSSSGGKNVLTVAYGSDYVFITPQLAKKWWTQVAQQFEAQHPGVTVKFTPIPGGLTDIVTKLNLLYRSPSTTPDVAELPSPEMGGWVSSGYLMQLDKYVQNADWWKRFPAAVQQETTFNGHVYAVEHGENTEALYYNIPMFRKAGIAVPWQPKNWSDLLSAAEKVHAAVPNVWPMWLSGGTAGGTGPIQYDGGNFILGSSNPTIYDASTKKWVVDSPGLRDTLGFYSQLAKRGLQAPAAELLSPNAIVNTFQSSAKQKMAILVSGNFTGEAWSKQVCGPCWPAGEKTYGVARIPTVNGTGNPNAASATGGWELGIAANASQPDLAWEFIQTAQQRVNMINAANWAGWVPPDSKYWTDPLFVNLAPAYQTFFAKLMNVSHPLPNLPDYEVWANGFNTATGQIIGNPSTTVDSAINTMKSYITGQLGASNVETLH